MDRLLVQTRASNNDQEFPAIDGVSFREFFEREGISPLEKDLIDSCHGCPSLHERLTREIFALAARYKVGVIEAGGLLFAKPSTRAAVAIDIPVVSVPLRGGNDLETVAAFLGFFVPSGLAAVGGVGVGDYQAAAGFMKNALLNDTKGVYVPNPNDKLITSLQKLRVPILGGILPDGERGIVIATDSSCSPTNNGGAYIRSFPNVSLGLVDGYMNPTGKPLVYVRGIDNAAFLAAKCLAHENDGIRQALAGAYESKVTSYNLDRKITRESFGFEEGK